MYVYSIPICPTEKKRKYLLTKQKSICLTIDRSMQDIASIIPKKISFSPLHEWIIVSLTIFNIIILSVAITAFSLLSTTKASEKKPFSLPVGKITPPIPLIYTGVSTGEAYLTQTHWNKFEESTGKKVSIFHEYQGIDASTCRWFVFPVENLGTTLIGFNTIRSHGAIPMLTLMTESLESVNSGAYDTCFAKLAKEAAVWGHPFFLRLDHEMNHGFVYGIGAPTPTPFGKPNTPKAFVKMWKHVHDIFTSQGAQNATWVWCPNVEKDPSGITRWPIKNLYPGDDYVDWTCIDGYNYNSVNNQVWQTFSNVFTYTYNDITKNIAPSKPLMIGEYSSAEFGHDPSRKARWFLSALTTEIPKKFPLIKAIVLWNGINYGPDDRIQSSALSEQAFKKGSSLDFYATNTFGDIECVTGWCPIKALTASVTPTNTPTPTTSVR